MRRTTKRIRVTENMRRKVRAGGSVLVCRQGGWPTHRLHFEEPSAEPWRDASSEPLINGQVYLAPDNHFNEFWISSAAVTGEPEDVILDVIDCATPVVELGRHFGGFEYHVVLNTNRTPIEVEPEVHYGLYADIPTWYSDTSGAITDTTRRHIIPRGYIGGGVSADKPFELHLYERLDTTTMPRRARIASWNVDNIDADSRFSVSLSFGAIGGAQSTWAAGFGQARDISWPLLGLEVYVLTGLANTNFEALIYERIPRT